jgi:hypothetical protein
MVKITEVSDPILREKLLALRSGTQITLCYFPVTLEARIRRERATITQAPRLTENGRWSVEVQPPAGSLIPGTVWAAIRFDPNSQIPDGIWVETWAPETRWTKPRPDGKPYSRTEPCECAHCDHVYSGFDQLEIIRHCREHHRAFYRHKWETELANRATVDQSYAPLPEFETENLGSGFQLVWQRSVKSNQVRAVIKDSAGTIRARGDVMPEERAMLSRQSALYAFFRGGR